MNLKRSLLVATLAFTGLANAQEFSLTGEFRPRTEYSGAGGPFTAGASAAGGSTAVDGQEGFMRTSVRAALNATYKSDAYTMYLGIQEVFLFGDRRQIQLSGNGNLRVQEAWADINLGEYSSLKVGRQPLSYDDQRILGGLGWAQQARTHDAAVFKYKSNGYSLDLGAALNTTGDEIFTGDAGFFSYRDMGFVRANKKYDALNISFLGLANTFQNVDNPDKSTLITTGLHADYSAGIVKLSANAFLQEGERIGGADVKGAYLASLDAVIKASDAITVLAGGEIISGQTEDSAAFFPLYGTNHKFNGLIDRFYVGNHANAEGLVDLNLGVKTSLSGYGITAKFHNFSGASDLASGDGRDALGNELDLVVKKKFNGFVLVGGASTFFEPDTVADNAKDVQGWAWLMLIIKPKFL